MFNIRVNDDGIVRNYDTEDYNSAVVLFDILTHHFRHVQVHDGRKTICEYKAEWAEQFAEIAERERERDEEYSLLMVEANQP